MATLSKTASAIKANLKDFNDFPKSVGDEPLKVSTFKGVIDEAKVLKLDASLRFKNAKEAGNTTYVLPTSRVVISATLQETFEPLIMNAVSTLVTRKDEVVAGTAQLESLEVPAEELEFVTQLYSAFKVLVNPVVKKVTAAGESQISTFIIGEVIDTSVTPSVTGSVYAQVLYIPE